LRKRITSGSDRERRGPREHRLMQEKGTGGKRHGPLRMRRERPFKDQWTVWQKLLCREGKGDRERVRENN